MKKAVKIAAGIVSVGVSCILALTLYAQSILPDSFIIEKQEELTFPSRLFISGDRSDLAEEGTYNMHLKLFESVSIKQVQVQVASRNMVIPAGTPFGIKMTTDGLMVVGMSDVQVGNSNVNPAKNAGLRVGDIVTHIDGNEVLRTKDIRDRIAASKGNEVCITVIRHGEELNVFLQPVFSKYDDSYKAGIWVRDSSAGIGTMTYFDPQTMQFAGLGHAVCDIDTGEVMPLQAGEIVDVNISGVNAGLSGRPGELKGTFAGGQLGILQLNTEFGIFGTLTSSAFLELEAVPIAFKQEIELGPATILSTISGNKPQSFDILIEKINYSDAASTKNMIIRIIDPHLLATTGGIVQGMSGSPILQDGKLVGAVTHVFVNDPTRGYGIFAENMEKNLESIKN